MDPTPLLNYISRYVNLSAEEEALLVSKAGYRKYLKGQFVVQQGDICRYENFVLSGCLKTFYPDPEGQEHIVMFAVENWWVTDLGSFITRTPARFNVQCLENTELVQFSYDTLEQLYLDIPKLERLFRIILQKAYVASQDRLVRNFSLPARERYTEFRRQYPGIEQRVPQYMIASYLGITKEFLSRIKNRPEEES
ncbi:Crp/Fnr family transcriptional regulator [Sinomicrobium weinanense]|uniref:Crp/Fnr family transcriptional regulator n=1 Tax=Sinomicrobium weinanense TaxID=2842200 RepID=A0A926JQK6_9FLAO|nr:Crp/Fnr family transcriptional regulator [Sinomicrobium weinanense]MBC9795660.1 Crp/Fnr family transcriptional regulator [Sinomicrobium weinanense]MBU3122829.1 Crp/Fnr family transcriptional regulator [Sinomicrobium weinanense]